jgi:hypothetical protein
MNPAQTVFDNIDLSGEIFEKVRLMNNLPPQSIRYVDKSIAKQVCMFRQINKNCANLLHRLNFKLSHFYFCQSMFLNLCCVPFKKTRRIQQLFLNKFPLQVFPHLKIDQFEENSRIFLYKFNKFRSKARSNYLTNNEFTNVFRGIIVSFVEFIVSLFSFKVSIKTKVVISKFLASLFRKREMSCLTYKLLF